MNATVSKTNHADLVYHTSNAEVVICNETESFTVYFFNQKITFRFCEFIVFKNKIQQIDLASLFGSDTPDIEILHLPHCHRIFALSVLEIIELKELLSGTFVMLELNSIIHRNILRKRV